MKDDKIISDDGQNTIGRNIRWIRQTQEMHQTEMVARLQLYRVAITRETLVKIEGGRQHIKLKQLRGFRDVFGVTYEDILDHPGEKLLREAEKKNMPLPSEDMEEDN